MEAHFVQRHAHPLCVRPAQLADLGGLLDRVDDLSVIRILDFDLELIRCLELGCFVV